MTMLRMKPTPESSDGAGEARVLLLTGVVVTRVAALVCEMLRVRLGTGVVDVARVLLSHVGGVVVTVALVVERLSSEFAKRRDVGVTCVRRLVG